MNIIITIPSIVDQKLIERDLWIYSQHNEVNLGIVKEITGKLDSDFEVIQGKGEYGYVLESGYFKLLFEDKVYLVLDKGIDWPNVDDKILAVIMKEKSDFWYGFHKKYEKNIEKFFQSKTKFQFCPDKECGLKIFRYLDDKFNLPFYPSEKNVEKCIECYRKVKKILKELGLWFLNFGPTPYCYAIFDKIKK